MKTERKDIYQEVTNKIIAGLENGRRPWFCPWEKSGGLPIRPTRSTGEEYRGINVLLLWDAAAEQGYNSSYWFTFQQAKKLNASVRKGEKSTTIFYAGAIEKTDIDDATGEEFESRIPFLKSYAVFNACQIEGLDSSYYASEIVPNIQDEENRIVAVDEFVKQTGADLRHGGDRAFYRPIADYIQMPEFQQFKSPEGYASTLAHELVHWTMAPARLDREYKAKRFGDEAYSREELVAEIGSAFLGADLGFQPELTDQNSSYIAGFLEVLKNDKRAIFTAAAHAQKACDYLHGLQNQSHDSELAA